MQKEKINLCYAIKTIEKIIDLGINLSNNDYHMIITSYNLNYKKINLSKILKKYIFKDFKTLTNYVKKHGYILYNLDFINLDPYGKDKIDENLSYLITILGDAKKLQNLMAEKKVIITENHLNYARTSTMKKFIFNNISKLINNAIEVNISDLDSELLKCSSVEEIDDFITKNNYNLSPETVILACQQNLNFELITHLILSKIDFNVNHVNELIKSYKDNENISKLLMLIYSYGCKFTQSNFIEMLSSKYYAKIFGENLGNNLIIDEQFVEYVYNCFVSHDLLNATYDYSTGGEKTNKESIELFLKNIEVFGESNKISAQGVLALYCSVIFKFGNNIVKIIKKLKQKYDVKLNNLCLKYLYINRNNVTKDIINLFKKDNVVPDLEASKQYILSLTTYKFAEMYKSLFDE